MDSKAKAISLDKMAINKVRLMPTDSSQAAADNWGVEGSNPVRPHRVAARNRVAASVNGQATAQACAMARVVTYATAAEAARTAPSGEI
jgi:hypothetical protein